MDVPSVRTPPVQPSPPPRQEQARPAPTVAEKPKEPEARPLPVVNTQGQTTGRIINTTA